MSENPLMTVTGPVPAQRIGKTSCHEHIFCDNRCYSGDAWKQPGNEWMRRPVQMEDISRIWCHVHQHLDNAVLNDPVLAEKELREYTALGGGTFIDCTCHGIDRRPETLKALSEKTGLQIAVGTGAYLEIAMPEWIKALTYEGMRDLFLQELNEGMDGTGIRAGFVGEIGISEGFTELEEQCLRAGARAAAMSGTALLIHQPGLKHENQHILDIIESEGQPLDRVLLCHNDPLWEQTDYLIEGLKRGCFMSFDTFGMQMVLGGTIPFPRDWDRLTAVKKLIEAGFGKQIVFGQDTCFKVQLHTYGGYGYGHIFREIPEYAGNMGYRSEWLDDILRKNPARLFTGTEIE